MAQMKDFSGIDRLVAEGKLNQAIGILTDYLQSDKTAVAAWSKLGELYLKKGDKFQATRCYWTSVKIQTKHGFYSNATVDLKKIIEFDPEDQAAYELLIELYNKLGQSALAKPYEDTLAKMKVSAENLEKSVISVLDHLTANVIESQIEDLISKAQAGDVQARALLKKIQRKVGKALQPVKMAAKKPSKK